MCIIMCDCAICEFKLCTVGIMWNGLTIWRSIVNKKNGSATAVVTVNNSTIIPYFYSRQLRHEFIFRILIMTSVQFSAVKCRGTMMMMMIIGVRMEVWLSTNRKWPYHSDLWLIMTYENTYMIQTYRDTLQ